MTTITLVHPGSMGAAVGAHAARSGARVLWLPAGRSAETRERARQAGFEPVDSLCQALAVSDIVLSICPPQYAEDVAEDITAHAFDGVFVDANAISPERMSRIAALVTARCPGSQVVDGSIFGPPPVNGKRIRLYVAGQDTSAVERVFKGTDVIVQPMAAPLGSASALKMAFASYQKAARTLAAVAHSLAHEHGVGDLLTKEAHIMASDILSNPDYLPSVAARAWRWRPEMHEVADALRSAALPTDLAEATAKVMKRWEADKDDLDLPLAEILAHLKDG
ncbi:DUF1932 domain-containing protein [Streptomyces luteireticuli]|uniref:NAD(P)-dependent oxidoreductase n=1 Tax=Streptomyces luteireticuli TaxID=173858 RepID=UPI0035562288